MNRTATVLAATVAALILAAGPAAADDVPVVTDLMTGEVVECFDAPYELEPGVWDCVRADDAAEWGFDTPAEEPDDTVTDDVACLVVVEDGCDSIGDPVTGASWDEDGWGEDGDVVADPAPEPEPVVIVVDNGDWGWSDAREAYSA